MEEAKTTMISVFKKIGDSLVGSHQDGLKNIKIGTFMSHYSALLLTAQRSKTEMTSKWFIVNLLQLLLWTQLVGVTALLLAAIGSTRWQASITSNLS
jgi:hypothetical protein